MNIRNWPFSRKLLFLSIGLPLVLILLLATLYFLQKKQQVVDTYVKQARGIVLMAESTREVADKLWQEDIFTLERAREYAAAGEKGKLLEMVPVITAIKAAKGKAEEAGYEIRVPKKSPRKAENEPDAKELEILNMFESDTAKRMEEHYFIDKEMNAVRYFRPIELTERCMYCHGDPDNSEQYWGNLDGKDPFGVTMEDWKVGERHGAFEIIMSLDDADKELQASMTIAGIIIVGGLVILALLSVFISRIILNPVKASLASVESMADGDFTKSCNIDQEDEIGRLGHAVESLRERFRAILGELRISAENLDASAGELKATSNELASTSEEMSAQSATVAQAGEELSANTEQLSLSANDITNSANTVAAGIEEMSASINEVAQNCAKESQIAHRANEKSHENRAIMSELGEAAQQIDKVLELISNIASQTNLLALNATIEAASAGEAGKGFAVVANEVKELSRQTAEATNQIAEQIGAIQNKTHQTVVANNEIADIIEEITSISQSIAAAVEEQSATSREISHTMQTVSQSTNDIARSIGESAEGAREVSRNVHGITTAAQSASASAMDTNSNAERLDEMSKRLTEIVNQFKI